MCWQHSSRLLIHYQNKNCWHSSILLKATAFKPFLVQWLTLILWKTDTAVSCLICVELHYFLSDLECPFLYSISNFESFHNLHTAWVVQWYNSRLPRGRPGFDSPLMHMILAVSVRRAPFTFSSSYLKRAWQQELCWTEG